MNYPFPKTLRKLRHRLRYLGCWLLWRNDPQVQCADLAPVRRRGFELQPLEPRVLLSGQDLLYPEAAPYAEAIHVAAALSPPKTITASSHVSDTLFTDADGEQFQVKLTGPGSVELIFDDDDG